MTSNSNMYCNILIESFIIIHVNIFEYIGFNIERQHRKVTLHFNDVTALCRGLPLGMKIART